MKAWITAAALSLAAISAAGQIQAKDRVEGMWISAVLRLERQNDFWFKNGDFPRAIQNLKFQAAIFPSNYDIVTNLGWMLENVEDNADALAIYIQFRENNPDNPEAYYPEAEYYFRKKAYDKVPVLIEPSLKVGKGPTPNSYRILAHAYEKIGLLADSERVWKAYIARDPSDLTAKANLDRVEKKLHGKG